MSYLELFCNIRGAFELLYYFSGASLDQIVNLLDPEMIGPAGGVSLFNGFVFFTYVIVWGTIGVLIER